MRRFGCLSRILSFIVIALVILFAIGYLGDMFFGDSDDNVNIISTKVDNDIVTPNSTGNVIEVPVNTGNTIDTKEVEAKSATVMIYMIGSDLESRGGCATSDLVEISKAKVGDNVNVVIQTGGCKTWMNDVLKNRHAERFHIKNGSIYYDEDLGTLNMTDSKNVTDFIKWAAKEYPADRYSIIFWDHGGGTIMGFGCDEMNPNSMLSLSDFKTAFQNAGIKFDFVGFDACLMGTVETAYTFADYADYLIASEETEPGGGWYYTNWLTSFEKNPSINTEELGREIIDDFVHYSSFYDETTLSIVKLSKIRNVFAKLSEYLASTNTVLENRGYSKISSARSSAKSFGDNDYEQVDIISYLNAAGNIDGRDALRTAIYDAVVYANGSVSDANGLAMYYPYKQPGSYTKVMSMLDSIGYCDTEYVNCFNTFISNMAYGHYYSAYTPQNTTSAVSQLTGYEETVEIPDYTNESWYIEPTESFDTSAFLSYDGLLELVYKNGNYVLSLTDEQWDSISYVEMEMLLDDGEGYLDFGTDTIYEFTEDGDLLADFDFTWMSLDGEQIVPFFSVEDEVDSLGRWHALGYVPATLNNDRDIEIICYWDDYHRGGVVKGYRYATDDLISSNYPQRNLMQFRVGDKLDFYADYYTYDGEFDACYYIGDTVTVGRKGLDISYVDLDYSDVVVISFHLVDLYQNDYWTEALEISY